MQRFRGKFSERQPGATLGTVLLIAFGVAILAFLIVIERQTWFHIRPVTGTALAMSYTATENGGAERHASPTQPATRP